MTKPNYNCDRCGEPCYVRPNKLAKQENSFCGFDCYSSFRLESSINNHTCPNCDIRFYSKYKQAKFCSRKCSNEARKGIFYDGSRTGCHIVTQKIQKEYLIEKYGYKCVKCGLGSVWNNEPLVLQIDHIDGNRKNNTFANLRLLCPNCHTQTPTWGRKNDSYQQGV